MLRDEDIQGVPKNSQCFNITFTVLNALPAKNGGGGQFYIHTPLYVYGSLPNSNLKW